MEDKENLIEAEYCRKADGYLLADGVEVAATRMCGHCGAHFVMVRGSGRVRGWCLRCARITCGKRECDPCVPYEKRLEALEKRNCEGRV